MSARTAEWHLLGHGSDPAPHSTTAVARLADTYEQAAVAIRVSFATRTEPIAAELVALFDAMAGSLELAPEPA